MKEKFLPLVVLFNFLYATSLQAQYCGTAMPSGTSVCIPSTDNVEPGFSSSEVLPCIIQNQQTDITIPFSCFALHHSNPDTITITGSGSVVIDSFYQIRIDEVSNLPCGLCWSTNKADNTVDYGEGGCLRIIGTTTDQVGQFTLSVKISINSTGQSFTYTNVPLTDVTGNTGKLILKVIGAEDTCPQTDFNSTGNTSSNCQ